MWLWGFTWSRDGKCLGIVDKSTNLWKMANGRMGDNGRRPVGTHSDEDLKKKKKAVERRNEFLFLFFSLGGIVNLPLLKSPITLLLALRRSVKLQRSDLRWDWLFV